MKTYGQCDQPYHIDCLKPPLSEWPEAEWFCPECEQEMADEDQADEEERAENEQAQEEEIRIAVTHRVNGVKPDSDRGTPKGKRKLSESGSDGSRKR